MRIQLDIDPRGPVRLYHQIAEGLRWSIATGALPVVFAVDLFNEGVDVPSIDLVMMLRPTESSVVFLQQLGRGLRVVRVRG